MQCVTTMDQQNWAAKLLGYRFDIEYKLGLENKGTDALSHMYEEVEFHKIIHYPNWEGLKAILDEVHQDAKLLTIIEDLKQGKEYESGFSYKQGALFYEGRLVLSSTSTWIPQMLEEFHETP